MLILSRAGLLALIVLYIHTYAVLVHVFAAPLFVTPDRPASNYRFTSAVQLGEHSSYPIVPSIHRPIKSHYTLMSEHLQNSEKSLQQIHLLRKRSVWDNIKSKFQQAGQAIKNGFQKAGNAIKHGFQKVGGAIKKGFQKAGNAIKNVAKKVWNGVKNVAHKVASGVKTAAKKVWNGIKNVAHKVANGVKTAAKKVANGVKHVANKVWNGVKNVAHKVANGVKTAANKVWNGIKHVANKVASGVKHAAQKVASGVKTAVKWVKHNGAKVAKFGLKVLSTASSIAAKVVKFIPGIGKPISTALNYASKLGNMASDAIHVNLGSHLDKAVSVMDKIQNPVGGVAGKILDNLKRDVHSKVDIRRELFQRPKSTIPSWY